MNDDLAAFTLDDLLADTDLATKPPAPVPTAPWPMYPVDEDPDETRRTQLQAKALASGRVRDWTRMTGEELWDEWLPLFEQDEDLARETALRECERMVRDKCEAARERLYRIKRSLVGWHARGRLDERYEQRGLEGVWWTRRDEAMTESEYADLPLPFKGLVRMLKYLACRRARIRPCDL